MKTDDGKPSHVVGMAASAAGYRDFAFRLLQTSPHGNALAVPLVVPGTKAHGGLSPLSYRTLPGETGAAPFRMRPLLFSV